MRFGVAAAALAALTLAAPAAAQQDALEVLRDAMEQLARNTEGVDDYTLTLRAGGLRTSAYVFREGDTWDVAGPDDGEVNELMRSVVLWPLFSAMVADFPDPDEMSEDALEEWGDGFVLAAETLDGRRVHALSMNLDGLVDEDGSEMPDSVRLFVDTQTRQILRMYMGGLLADMAEISPTSGEVAMTMDFRDYRETDGVTVPRRLRLDMRMDLGLTAEQRMMMQAGIQAARAEAAADDSAEGRETVAVIDLFMGLIADGHLAMDVDVEDVQVNTGPPAWLDN